jgi:hypothetical protein
MLVLCRNKEKTYYLLNVKNGKRPLSFNINLIKPLKYYNVGETNLEYKNTNIIIIIT